MSTHRNSVLSEVGLERERQIAKGFGDTNDDMHSPNEWRDILTCYSWKAWLNFSLGSMDRARNTFIKVAALSVAVVESIDRFKDRAEGKEHIRKDT